MEKAKESDILNWIDQSMNNEDFVERDIVLAGTSGKTEGYTSDVVFAKVSGLSVTGNKKEVGLAIKIGKENEILRKQLPWMRELFLREISIYDKILPAFKKFQEERNVMDSFDAVPKCYKTFLTDSAAVIILEDLRTFGYKLHDKCVPMNLQHIKLVLSNYAKFHATSFAFRDQKPDEYNELTSNHTRLTVQMAEGFSEILKSAVPKVVQHLTEASRKDLAELYEKTIGNNYGLPLDILKAEVQHSVITHGDCHNNNFIFQYKDNDEENPTRLAIIDWQASTQHSPVMDLTYFLHAVAGEHLYETSDLLKFYYTSLTNYAKEMGTDLSVIYSYTTLMEDWRKYSFYGFAHLTAWLEILFIREDDAPNLDDAVADDTNVMATFVASLKLDNHDEYRKRLIQIVDHYCNDKI